MRRALVLAAVLLARAACETAALGQSEPLATAPQPRSYFENFDYQVEIDGSLSPLARFFNANGRASLLLMAPELKGPLVLQINSREVLTVDPRAVIEGPVPERVLIQDSEVHGPPAPFTYEGEAAILFQDGRRIRISRKPPVVGQATQEEILARLPIYRKGMEAYSPAEHDTVYLKSYRYPVQVEVFFGSWCSHCKEVVPRFLKSMSVAANPNIQISFVGVPFPPFDNYAPAKQKDVRGVPTFIVYAENREIGRISQVPGDSSAEHELVKILFAYQQTKG